MAAYALARFQFAGQRTVLMFLITTQMFPLVLLCIPYFRIFITLGLYDTRTSLVDRLPDLHPALLHPDAAQLFLNIPRDIEEAAMVDGCTRLGAVFRTSCRCPIPPSSERGSTRSCWPGTSSFSRSC